MTRPGEHLWSPGVPGWSRVGEISGVLTETTAWLPFDRPVRSSLTELVTDSPVVAHYYPPTPMSVTNEDIRNDADAYEREYWLPPGNVAGLEAGSISHTSYGGLTRDYYYRGPAPDGDARMPARPFSPHRLTEAQMEISDAKEGLLDGFTTDLLSTQVTNNINSQVILRMYEAASGVTDFPLIPMPDGGGGVVASTSACVTELDFLTDFSAAWQIDGEYLVMPYRPEGVSPVSGSPSSEEIADSAAEITAFWTDVKNGMTTASKPIKLWPCFTDTWTSTRCAQALNAISYGLGRWGNRDFGSSNNSTAKGEAFRAYDEFGGKPWLHYWSPQDARPKTGNYWEAKNTTAFRGHFDTILNGTRRPAFVQVPTWNDQSECTGVCPSDSVGYLWLDLLAYYITWYKTRIQPTILRDTTYLTHRIHHTTVNSFTGGQTGRQALNTGTTSPAQNLVEALVFLTEPGTVNITVAGTTTTSSAPAGISAHYATLPAGVDGAVSAEVTRNGSPVPYTLAESPHLITTTPVSQDLQYKGVTSRDSLRVIA